MQTKVESNLKDLIGDLGKSIDEYKSASDPVSEYMVFLGQQITSMLKTSLRDEGEYQNSLLHQSIAPEITTSVNGITLTITANDYWRFINAGVDGIHVKHGSIYSFKTPYPNKAMAKSIQTWMGNRGIGDASNFKSISYAIATKVKRIGIEPTYFVDKVMTDEFINQIAEGLAEATGKSLNINIV